MEASWVDELDGQAAADALAASHARIVETEAAQVRLVAHWCDLHNGDALDAQGRLLPGMERAVRIGAAGTPKVREFAAAELGILLAMTTTSAQWLMRDVLDLRHRHPLLWRAVQSGAARFWQARQIARATHGAGLSLEQARRVDARTAPHLGSVPWGRMLGLVDAAVIEADPESAEARRLAAAMERFVRTGQCNELGLKTIYARAEAGDAIFFLAMCDRIAEILALRGDTDPADVRRAKAIGILASPVRALALLGGAESDAGEPGTDPFLPRATLYVHLSRDAFVCKTRDAARVEGVGAVTVEQAVDLLRHCRVTVKPVLDLAESWAVDGYETPDRVKEIVELRYPFEVFPLGTRSSRKADKDHSTPYVPTASSGPPAQTSADNLGPLGRYLHRVRTHGLGWHHSQPAPGVFLWRTPHGYWARVDSTGTQLLGKAPAHGQSTLEAALARLVAA